MNLQRMNELINKVKDRVENHDNEGAHSYEDELYVEFISLVAISADGKLKEMAKKIIRVQNMDFDRWYA